MFHVQNRGEQKLTGGHGEDCRLSIEPDDVMFVRQRGVPREFDAGSSLEADEKLRDPLRPVLCLGNSRHAASTLSSEQRVVTQQSQTALPILRTQRFHKAMSQTLTHIADRVRRSASGDGPRSASALTRSFEQATVQWHNLPMLNQRLQFLWNARNRYV